MRHRFTPLLGLLLLFCASCESPNYKPPGAAPALAEDIWKEHVHMSQAAWQTVRVLGVRETRKNTLLQVQIDLKSKIGRRRGLRTRFEWFDGSGFKLDGPNESWMNQLILAEEEFSLGAIATNPKAQSWRLNVEIWSR